MRIRLTPDKTRIPFMSYRHVTFSISIALMLVTFVAWIAYGFNFGIDFTGGTLIEAKKKTEITASELRELVEKAGLEKIHVQEFQKTNIVQLRAPHNSRTGDELQINSEKIKQLLEKDFEIHNLEVIGPAVSAELKRDVFIAICTSILLILFYLWIRFEWQYALGAVLTTLHDVILTLGFMIISGMTFNLPILAAILTIVGYSLNDTIVIYDRIRESMRTHRISTLSEIIDLSINQTLSRTVMTSVTILIAALTLLIFSGKALYGFNITIVLGIVVGTYSSVVISAPLLIILDLPRKADHTERS